MVTSFAIYPTNLMATTHIKLPPRPLLHMKIVRPIGTTPR